MTTETILTEMITESRGLFGFLWPVALGEPVGPEGTVYDYGDDQLAELMYEAVQGDTQGWPPHIASTIAKNKGLWNKARTLTIEQVMHLDDDAWTRIREAVMVAHPMRVVACPYCREPLVADEHTFHMHYIRTKCWDRED